MRVRWQNGRRTQFIKVCSYKHQDKNRFCWIINTWTNQKTMYPVSSKTYTHGNKSLFNWYVWFLYMISFSIPRTFTLRSILPTLSFCAKPKTKSQIPSSNKLPSPLKRVATVADVVLGRGRAFSHTPHPHKREPTPEEKGFLSLVNSTAKCNKWMIHEEYLNRCFHSST